MRYLMQSDAMYDDDEEYKDRRKPSRQEQKDDFQFPDEVICNLDSLLPQ